MGKICQSMVSLWNILIASLLMITLFGVVWFLFIVNVFVIAKLQVLYERHFHIIVIKSLTHLGTKIWYIMSVGKIFNNNSCYLNTRCILILISISSIMTLFMTIDKGLFLILTPPMTQKLYFKESLPCEFIYLC